ncbi:hypothetical protein VNO78_08591 [Psophocarpus tetragonolobus]|uniref:Uncharacterized protein n=1 Tax=Psophocarpus tetragonolobus TaxID=3891 RepID=A0AAN9SY85_PSOTE
MVSRTDQAKRKRTGGSSSRNPHLGNTEVEIPYDRLNLSQLKQRSVLDKIMGRPLLLERMVKLIDEEMVKEFYFNCFNPIHDPELVAFVRGEWIRFDRATLTGKEEIITKHKISHSLGLTIDKAYMKKIFFHQDKPEKLAQTSAPRGFSAKMFREAMQHRQNRENAIFRGLLWGNNTTSLTTSKSATRQTSAPQTLTTEILATATTTGPNTSTTTNKGKGVMMEEEGAPIDDETVAAYRDDWDT